MAITHLCLKWQRTFVLTLVLATSSQVAWCRDSSESEMEQLKSLSLEDLLNIEVTSASKKSQKLTDTAAAIFVINSEDIRRSGKTSVPELLRMVPGIQVARIDINKWSISARGLSGRFANKLLVLIDGRSVYTPTFSGVYWDVQDMPLDDIERIEVIRGPGATLWGANAVNGVINIITKSAEDTQQGLVSVGAGNVEKAFTDLRYGGELGDSGWYRLSGKLFNREDLVATTPTQGADEWEALRLSFRADLDMSDRDALSVSANTYRDEIVENAFLPVLTPPYIMPTKLNSDASGYSVIANWDRDLGDDADFSLKAYYDHTDREDSLVDNARDERDTFDVEFTHRFQLTDAQELIWGVGYRWTQNTIKDSALVSFPSGGSTDQLFNVYIQDDIALLDEQLHLTVGSKFEHNDYTGVEIQPNLRAHYSINENRSIWAAVSRAVRTPSSGENDGQVVAGVVPAGVNGNPFPTLLKAFGTDTFDSEVLTAYELGYKAKLLVDLYLDLALFYNDYSNARSIEAGTPFPSTSPPHLVAPLFAANSGELDVSGLELSIDWSLSDRLRLYGAYHYLSVDAKLSGNGGFDSEELIENRDPDHQLSWRVQIDVTPSTELDLWARYTRAQNVDPFTAIDLRYAWRATEDLALSLVGQNLLEDRAETQTELFGQTGPIELRRSVYLKASLNF